MCLGVIFMIRTIFGAQNMVGEYTVNSPNPMIHNRLDFSANGWVTVVITGYLLNLIMSCCVEWFIHDTFTW